MIYTPRCMKKYNFHLNFEIKVFESSLIRKINEGYTTLLRYPINLKSWYIGITISTINNDLDS